jgi:hypothetical protein
MSRPTVIGPDGKKMFIPSGMSPKMERNAHGIMVCKGIETQEEVLARERQYNLQRLRDAPDARQPLGQLRIKAFETGGNAFFMLAKELDDYIQLLKVRYPDVLIPVRPSYPPNQVESDTQLIRMQSYLTTLQRWEKDHTKELQQHAEATHLRQVQEQTRQVEHMRKIEEEKQLILPLIAAEIRITPGQLSSVLAHYGYQHFTEDKMTFYQTINQFAAMNGLTVEQGEEILQQKIKKTIMDTIYLEPDLNKRRMLLKDVFTTEIYWRQLLTASNPQAM